MKKILYIDDDLLFLKRFEEDVHERYPGIEVITCQDPVKALGLIEPSLDLLIVDLEMPKLDGKKILTFAIGLGVDKKKIIIISSREANYLHELIPMGQCLCVLNKHEISQQKVLEMVLDSIQKKK